MEHLKADYTEVWISAPVVPLVQFADQVRPISSTQLDLVGLGMEFPASLAEILATFDEVVSWYGSNRPDFRAEMNCVFLDALPPRDCPQHATDFFLKQVGAPPGSVPRINVAAEQHRQTVVIHPFSGSPSKNWPLDRYQALAEQLPLPVEWLAGPEEKLSGAVRFDNLRELAVWLRGAALYIGNDSGISHLAAAIGVPTAVLFGATDPACWAPRGENVTVLQADSLQELASDTVLKAVVGKL